MCWIGDGHFFVTIKVSNMTIPHVGHIPLAQHAYFFFKKTNVQMKTIKETWKISNVG